MRKKKNKAKPKTRKSLSAKSIQDLRTFAGQIGKIIPATSFSKNGFCFRKIALDYDLKQYWQPGEAAKDTIFNFIKEVYRLRPRLFYKIIRENIARGIERRHRAGDPVLADEIDQFDKTLRDLNINLSEELKSLNLPKERPAIVPPPHHFQMMIEKIALHPFLLPECIDLFKDGHINDSVRRSLEKYEVYIQKKSALQNQGTDLMAQAFNENAPTIPIKIADIATKRGKGLQEGFRFISMGAMGFWRNLFSHGDEKPIPHQDAVAIIATISHMLFYTDNNQLSK